MAATMPSNVLMCGARTLRGADGACARASHERPPVWRLTAAAAMALSALAPIPALAQTTVYHPGSANVQVQVTASVGGRCGFAEAGAPSGSFHQPHFDTAGFSHDFEFVLDCTGPARVAVVSANGGLLTGGTADPGYATLAPYEVTLNLVANGGSPTAAATCAAATLTTGSTCSFLGPAGPTQGLRLTAGSTLQPGSYLRVSAAPYSGAAQLLAGTYGDTLTVTLSASP